jgi:cytosine/adenosine deaminase-related metal-dependent hydrolase
MEKMLIKNAKTIITCDANDRILYGEDILIEGTKISAIGKNLSADGAKVIDGSDMFVYPGLVNTHHHLMETFTRNIPKGQSLELTPWLNFMWPIWTNVDSDYMYYASMVSLGEMLKYGCTTVFDHHYGWPRGKGRDLVDREFQASEQLGVRFLAGRSCITIGEKDGAFPCDELVETTDEFLTDCDRLIDKYHSTDKFAMKQVVVAPCSVWCNDTATMVESAKFARSKGVRLHTHLAEGKDEDDLCMAVNGKRVFDWAQDCGWVGPDVWYAHGIHFTDRDLDVLAETQTGVAHCPICNMKLASGVCKVPQMLEKGVPVGLAVDGTSCNDSSNLLNELRVGWLMHRLNSSSAAPSGYDMLKIATNGSAKVLGRDDIGSLTEEKAADLFMINVNKLEYSGALEDPASFLATVGYCEPVDMTIVNGKIVYQEGKLTGINEEQVKEIKARADIEAEKVYSSIR